MKQQIDFENLELSFYAKFVLRTLPLLKSEFFYNKNVIRDLWERGLIRQEPRTLLGYFVYTKTSDGKMYFRIKRKRFFHFWIPVLISVLALLAAYDVVYIKWLAELLSAIAKIPKTILENLGISTSSIR